MNSGVMGMAGLVAGALLLTASGQALATEADLDTSAVEHVREAEEVAAVAALSWSWGESNSGTNAVDEKKPDRRDEDPGQSGIDKASPTLM